MVVAAALLRHAHAKRAQDKENLKMMMNLLRDKSPNIQYEAFHVFKVKVFFFLNVFLVMERKLLEN